MTRRRFRRGNFQAIDIPAPVGLMRTSETSIGMSLKYAVDLENHLPTKKRRISKRGGIADLGITGIPVGDKIIAGSSLGLSDGTFKLLACTDAGEIYETDNALTAWSLLRTGLSTNGTYRFSYFDQKVVIVNGIDPNMYWDGTAVLDIKEFVTDSLAGTITKVDTDTFSFTDGAMRGTTDYPIGRNIKIFMDGSATAVDGVVLASSGTVGGTITVDLTTNIITGTVIDDVQYEDSPPPFSFIYTAHDRLWALTGGELKAEAYRDLDADNNLAVFYTEGTNNVNSWFNVLTQDVPFINMENKHIKNDEFVGIALYQSKLVFFGRRATQIWGGTDPTGITDPLTWIRTFSVGCVHGDLIEEVENDISFYTPSEIRQFKVVTITNDLESSQEAGANLVERVSDQVDKLLASDDEYKKAKSFTYPRGGFVGFRLPEEVHIRVEEQDFEGWARFTQLFQQCSDYTVATDGKLYMFFEGDTFVYDDSGNEGSDNGVAMRTSWTVPFIQPKEGHTFAGKYYELITEAGDTMDVEITRYKNNSICNAKATTVVVSPLRSSFWDEAQWDVDFWDCATETRLPTQEDKFIAETFSYSIKTENTLPSIDIIALRVYGRVER